MEFRPNNSLVLVPFTLLVFLILFFPLSAGKLLAYFVLAFVAYKAAKQVASRKRQ